MKLTNDSNYPVTVNGKRIETGSTIDVEIQNVEKYRNDRRVSLEDDDNSAPDEGEEEIDDEEISKPEEQEQENKGD